MPAKTSFGLVWAAKWLPALLLCGVVANHNYRVRTQRMNPRLGGGFGMFSVLDRPSGRIPYAEGVDREGNRRPILIDFGGTGSLNELSTRLGQRVRAMPDDDILDRLADILIETQYRVEDPRVFANLNGIRQSLELLPPGTLAEPYFRSLRPTDRSTDGGNATQLEGIRLQMRRVVFEAKTTRYTTEPYTEWRTRGRW